MHNNNINVARNLRQLPRIRFESDKFLTACATLDKATRAKTLVVEPSREGRDALTADIRAALAKSGALSGPAIEIQTLVAKGLTRAEARLSESYDKGDIVRFTRDYADKGVVRGEAYRVEGVDSAKAAVALKAQDGREIDWRLRQWGAGKAQAFAPQSLELKTGGRSEVIAINEQARTAVIRGPRG